jgi:hypothetical protein
MSSQADGSGTGVKSIVQLTPPISGVGAGTRGETVNFTTSPALTVVGVRPFTIATELKKFCPMDAVRNSIEGPLLSEILKLLPKGPAVGSAYHTQPE